MKRLWLWLVVSSSLLPSGAGAQCSYQVTPTLDFGTILGVPTPQIDVTASIQVTCPPALFLRRVCLSIPVGTGGINLDDRRMITGSHFVQFQVYRNAARTDIWGDLGGVHPPHPVDFGLLGGTQTATVYGRVFAGQTGKSVGTYQSNLTPIRARSVLYLLPPPSCQSVVGNEQLVPSILARLVIDTNCTVNADPLDFGTVTEISGHAANSTLSVTCTLNGPFSIALNGGEVTGDINDRRMQLDPGPDTIAYQLYKDGAHTQIWGNTPSTDVDGTGTGNPQSFTVFGLVPAQGPKPSGTYEDTITVTVSF